MLTQYLIQLVFKIRAIVKLIYYEYSVHMLTDQKYQNVSPQKYNVVNDCNRDLQDNRWNGDWSHDCSKWDSLDPTVESRLPHGGESGDFWMSKDDWVKQFESMTICLMPDFFTNYHQREVLHHILYIRVHSHPLSQV